MENRILLLEVIVLGIIIRLLMDGFKSTPEVIYEWQAHSVEATAQLMALLLGWMYALILGLGMFASEYVGRTMQYLVTRPLSRKEILGTKWCLGIVELLIAMFALGMVNGFYDGLEIPVLNGVLMKHGTLSFFVYLNLLGMMFYLMGGFISIVGKDLTRVSFLTVGLAVLIMSFLIKMDTNGIAWKYPLVILIEIVCFLALLFAGFSLSFFQRPSNH